MPCCWLISRRPTKEANSGVITGPRAATPPIGFGRSSTTNRLPASAAPFIESYIVQM
jgi:hypothetical protein